MFEWTDRTLLPLPAQNLQHRLIIVITAVWETVSKQAIKACLNN